MNQSRETAIASLEGYLQNGAHYWPGAHYFTLIGLDANGESTGAASDLCRDCVRRVAGDALAAIRGEAHVPFVGDGALAACGPDPLYELWGISDTHISGYGEPTFCAECGIEIE